MTTNTNTSRRQVLESQLKTLDKTKQALDLIRFAAERAAERAAELRTFESDFGLLPLEMLDAIKAAELANERAAYFADKLHESAAAELSKIKAAEPSAERRAACRAAAERAAFAAHLAAEYAVIVKPSRVELVNYCQAAERRAAELAALVVDYAYSDKKSADYAAYASELGYYAAELKRAAEQGRALFTLSSYLSKAAILGALAEPSRIKASRRLVSRRAAELAERKPSKGALLWALAAAAEHGDISAAAAALGSFAAELGSKSRFNRLAELMPLLAKPSAAAASRWAIENVYRVKQRAAAALGFYRYNAPTMRRFWLAELSQAAAYIPSQAAAERNNKPSAAEPPSN